MEFRLKMTADQPETVAGAIDVALISKGEGFVWVKQSGSAVGPRIAP
jgi:hypothetical protein